MDDSQGQTTTSGPLHVGLWTDLSLRRDQNENENDRTNARPWSTQAVRVHEALDGPFLRHRPPIMDMRTKKRRLISNQIELFYSAPKS